MPPLPIASDTRMDDAKLLAAVVDTAGSVMVGLRRDHRVFLWNAAAEALYQTPREAALNTNYIERFIAPEHREAVAADIAQVLDGKLTQNFEDDSILPDGSRRTLLWNVTRVVDADGTPFGILAIGQDITERKEAEERFRVLFEHVDDGLVLSDASGVIDCNPAALRILGVDKAQLIGRRPAEFSPPVQPDGQASDAKSRALGRETARRGGLSFEWVHQRPDGTQVPVDVVVRHASLGGRRISVVSWHDLTRRKALEREEHEVQARLRQAQKLEAVGQLAGGVAHDFNNLLTAVRNGVELARGAIGADHDVQPDLQLALEAVDRAAALTRQLLAYSRREATRREAVDLAEVATATLRLLRSSISTSITVRERCAEPATVSADRSQLEQVVMNLLLNARDAMPGGGDLHVEVRADPAAGVARLLVTDTGIGMDASTQERIFEPFFTTKGVGGGTGLGLAVVYGIVTQSGGEITCESTPGAGSRFEITLPLLREPAAAGAGPDPVVGNGAQRVVLLVEDEAMVRASTERLLHRLGWQVLVAEDGEAGWETFQRHADNIAIVATDVRMPRLDGLCLARRIRDAKPSCPILFLSGYDSVSGMSSTQVAATGFLAKPFTLASLGQALHDTLRLRIP